MKHAPTGYACPFCGIADTLPLPAPESAVVLVDDRVFALVPTHHYGGIVGNCLVIPRSHYENVFDIPDDLGHDVFRATRRVLPGMAANGWGRIINISSVEGKQANKAMISHYITNKHAINGFTKATAFEYGTQGITCNALCPGAIETDIMRQAGAQVAEQAGITYEQFLAGYAADAAIKRLNTVEEVAAMATLLASNAGAGITGALLNIDGGTSQY
jgi:3-hydroxybutyrate dehydrogenase/3-oxoacyl-[acyl-carrier protein] reductase